ncbi:MAG: radical SAM family heme chaperone HemW [Prevotella sp.]|nr:radical SAM family heme chaperone HemW [Prevotella sp.]
MAGLYVHIPFCKSRCIYCGFYSTTLAHLTEEYVEAVCAELEATGQDSWHKNLLENVETVYIGGGTPSLLPVTLLQKLFDAIENRCGSLAPLEVTMECNPDDLTDEYAEALGRLPVNRISMGAQTFADNRLSFLHRRHTSRQVSEAVKRLRHIGIGNISIDLMFGFPGETLKDWEADIGQALALQVEHISAYNLMFEEGTPLYKLREEGKVKETDEELSLKMYETLIDRLSAAGYEHYEISNFARPGFHSRHNSSYWDGTPYIGLGAAAHSYDIDSRWWNISDVEEYISRMKMGESPIEEREVLNEATRFDDTVMTALRTSRGLSLDHVEEQFGRKMKDYLMTNAAPHLQANRLTIDNNGFLRLTRQGLFVSDSVMADLMYV